MKPLIVWTGPVHSGKSTKALLRAKRYLRFGNDVVLIRPSQSVRPEQGEEPGMLVTKTGHKYPSIEVDSADDILAATEGATVVWIDEPMLFPREVERQLVELVAIIRKQATVLVSGLAATSELTVFGSAMPRLLALADEIHHCMSDCDYCSSLGTASRSVCTVPKDVEVLVGGSSIYKASCVPCWSNLG